MPLEEENEVAISSAEPSGDEPVRPTEPEEKKREPTMEERLALDNMIEKSEEFFRYLEKNKKFSESLLYTYYNLFAPKDTTKNIIMSDVDISLKLQATNFANRMANYFRAAFGIIANLPTFISAYRSFKKFVKPRDILTTLTNDPVKRKKISEMFGVKQLMQIAKDNPKITRKILKGFLASGQVRVKKPGENDQKATSGFLESLGLDKEKALAIVQPEALSALEALINDDNLKSFIEKLLPFSDDLMNATSLNTLLKNDKFITMIKGELQNSNFVEMLKGNVNSLKILLKIASPENSALIDQILTEEFFTSLKTIIGTPHFIKIVDVVIDKLKGVTKDNPLKIPDLIFSIANIQTDPDEGFGEFIKNIVILHPEFLPAVLKIPQVKALLDFWAVNIPFMEKVLINIAGKDPIFIKNFLIGITGVDENGEDRFLPNLLNSLISSKELREFVRKPENLKEILQITRNYFLKYPTWDTAKSAIILLDKFRDADIALLAGNLSAENIQALTSGYVNGTLGPNKSTAKDTASVLWNMIFGINGLKTGTVLTGLSGDLAKYFIDNKIKPIAGYITVKKASKLLEDKIKSTDIHASELGAERKDLAVILSSIGQGKHFTKMTKEEQYLSHRVIINLDLINAQLKNYDIKECFIHNCDNLHLTGCHLHDISIQDTSIAQMSGGQFIKVSFEGKITFPLNAEGKISVKGAAFDAASLTSLMDAMQRSKVLHLFDYASISICDEEGIILPDDQKAEILSSAVKSVKLAKKELAYEQIAHEVAVKIWGENYASSASRVEDKEVILRNLLNDIEYGDLSLISEEKKQQVIEAVAFKAKLIYCEKTNTGQLLGTVIDSNRWQLKPNIVIKFSAILQNIISEQSGKFQNAQTLNINPNGDIHNVNLWSDTIDLKGACFDLETFEAYIKLITKSGAGIDKIDINSFTLIDENGALMSLTAKQNILSPHLIDKQIAHEVAVKIWGDYYVNNSGRVADKDRILATLRSYGSDMNFPPYERTKFIEKLADKIKADYCESTSVGLFFGGGIQLKKDMVMDFDDIINDIKKSLSRKQEISIEASIRNEIGQELQKTPNLSATDALSILNALQSQRFIASIAILPESRRSQIITNLTAQIRTAPPVGSNNDIEAFVINLLENTDLEEDVFHDSVSIPSTSDAPLTSERTGLSEPDDDAYDDEDEDEFHDVPEFDKQKTGITSIDDSSPLSPHPDNTPSPLESSSLPSSPPPAPLSMATPEQTPMPTSPKSHTFNRDEKLKEIANSVAIKMWGREAVQNGARANSINIMHQALQASVSLLANPDVFIQFNEYLLVDNMQKIFKDIKSSPDNNIDERAIQQANIVLKFFLQNISRNQHLVRTAISRIVSPHRQVLAKSGCADMTDSSKGARVDTGRVASAALERQLGANVSPDSPAA